MYIVTHHVLSTAIEVLSIAMVLVEPLPAGRFPPYRPPNSQTSIMGKKPITFATLLIVMVVAGATT